MSKNKNYLLAMIESYLKKVGISDKNNIDNAILDDFLSDTKLSEGLEMFDEKINNISEKLLPTLNVQYKIANISVGKAKIIKLELLNIPLSSSDKTTIRSITGLEPIGGISWNTETQSFEGIAENAGTFELYIKGTFESSKGYKQHTEGTCSLTVIADPKSLWKTIDPDDSIPFPKEHEDSMAEKALDGSRLLYASKRGRSHAHVGTYRDDDGKILVTDAGWSVLVIADGGGSYPLSRRGSKVAVDQSISALEKVLSGEIGKELEKAFFRHKELNNNESKDILDVMLKNTMVSAAYTGFNGIVEEAKKNSSEIKDYSTTLLMAAHKLTPKGHLVLSFWVGDGVIVIYSKGKEVQLLGDPDSGEFAGQTRFLDNSFFHDTSRVSIQLVDDFTALILATDGVSDPYFETDEALGQFKKWDNFWTEISEYVTNDDIDSASDKLLLWLDFWSTGNHDDRTIALLLPSDQQEQVTQTNDNEIDVKKDKSSIETIEDGEIPVEVSAQDIQQDFKPQDDKENDVDADEDSFKSTEVLGEYENGSEPNIDTIKNNVEIKDNDNNA